MQRKLILKASLTFVFIFLTNILLKAQPNGCDLAAIRTAFTNAGCVELSGPNPTCSMYFLATQSMTGSQAQAFAEGLGANLVSIQSAAENQEVFTGLQNNYPGYNPGDVYWIGANDISSEGTFVWYDQNPFNYTNWDPGEPNNQTSSCCSLPSPFTCNDNSCNGGEDCVQLRSNGMWNDLPCADQNNGSIIEVSLCPQITMSPDQTICFGGSATISASTILGSTPYTYSWSNGGSGSSITVSPTTTTTYSVTVTGRYGCTATGDVTVTVDASTHMNGCDLDAIRAAFLGAGCIELSGCNPGCSMYFFTPQSMTGDQAQAFAQTFGANLVSIQDAAENQEVINGLNAKGLGGVIWIGFNDQASENNFVWYDQKPVTYTNWASGEPNNVTPSCCTLPIFGCGGSQCNGEDCTQMYPNGQWNDLPCGGSNNGSVIEVNLCPQITATADFTVCSGATVNLSVSNTILGSNPYSYAWSNNATGTSTTVSPIANTTYTVSVTDRYGCVGTQDIVATIATNNADAGADVAICDGESTQLNGSGGTSFSWAPTTSLSDPNIANPVANPNATTTYTVTASVQINGTTCTNRDDVVVTVHPLPLANAGADLDLCLGHSVQLLASGGTAYSWAPGTGLNDPSIADPVANPNATTTYTVTVTDANSCSATDDITITVNPLPSPQFNGLDNSYCADAPGALLTGQPAGGTFAGPGINGNTFVPNSAGEGAHVISYSYTDANGCTDSTLQGVRVDPLPELEIIGLDSAYCLNDPITNISTNPPDGNLTGTGITNPNNFDPSGSGGAGQYMVTYSYMDANGCDDTITQQVTIHSFPASSITPVDAVCYGYTDGQATVTPGSGTGPYQYEWNSVPRQFNDTATGLAAGNYTVTITDANGCTFEQTTTVGEPIELDVEIIPEADSLFLGEDTALNIIHNAVGDITYEWSPEEFLSCTDCPSPQARPIGPPLSEHEFTVTITDSNGCHATNTVILTIRLEKVYFTPNAFTPNGDGINDYFEVYSEGADDFNLLIFDRWGSVVYQTNDPDFKWDGTFKGKLLDPGLYIYRLSMVYLDNIYIKDAGSVTLLR